MLGGYAAARLQRRIKRLHRRFAFELITVGALALTGPAAVITTTGHLGQQAALVWVGWWAYFASSVFVVRMLIEAARLKSTAGLRAPTVTYHALLAAALATAPLVLDGALAWPLVAGFAPALLRGFVTAWRLAPVKPPLVKLGIMELGLTTWALACSVAALRAL
jgi:hypothetical protein